LCEVSLQVYAERIEYMYLNTGDDNINTIHRDLGKTKTVNRQS